MIKRIPVSEDRLQQLGEMKQAGQTYDELLGEMAKTYNRKQLAFLAKSARSGKGKWHKIDK